MITLVTHDPGYLLGAGWLFGSAVALVVVDRLCRTAAARDRARAVARRSRGGVR